MYRRKRYDIMHRWEGDPIITLDDLPFQAADISNAGAVKFDNKYILLVTIERLNGVKVIHLAESTNGYHFDIHQEPLFTPDKNDEFKVYEERGVYDARVARLDDYYYITHGVFSRHGFLTRLARTKDFKEIERLGLLTEPDTKASALFPSKINGKYAKLSRPFEGSSIWVSYSDDLHYWGWHEVVMTPRGGFWDSNRIGAGTPPVAIEQGWLFIYYGIKDTSAGPLFRLGAAILDKGNPAIVVGRTNIPILTPRKDYERIGDIPNLVYSCGKIIEDDGELKLYYGASNSCICIGTTKVEEVVSACLESAEEF